MVVVPVAQNQPIGCVHVDAEFPGVAGKQSSLPGIEEDLHAFHCDPNGEAVLAFQARFSAVVHDYLYLRVCHCRFRFPNVLR